VTDERESSADPATGVDPVIGVDDVHEVAAAAHLEPSGASDGVDHAALRESEHRAHAIAGAVYGTILATTVVASLGHDPNKLEHSLAIVLFTSAVFWAAHVYSLMVAGRMVAGRKLTRVEVREIAVNEWPMLQSSLPVALPLLLGILGVIDRDDAATIAMLVGIGALFFYGVLLGRREGRGRISMVWNAFVVGSFGILILLLKVVVH
jgi:hypothetical protein